MTLGWEVGQAEKTGWRHHPGFGTQVLGFEVYKGLGFGV